MVFSTGFGGYSPFEFWYYGWVGPTVTDALRLAALLPANAPALLALVWALWLRHITRKNTEREQRRSLLRGLKNAFLARDLKLPVQKRLRRRSLVRNLALWAIMLTAVLCCVPVYEMLWNSSLTVICVFVPAFALIGVLEIFWIRRDWTLVRDIGLLADQVTAIRDGDLETPLDLPADADLHQTAEQLNDIQAGLHRALAEQTRSERMKVELISNVSHDLKTPLTSVLSYAELLRQEPLEGAAADYARIIDEKARRLAVMVQDVFEVSKAASGQLPVHLERLDFAKLLRQTLADLEGPISQSGLTFRWELPEIPVMITADGRRLYPGVPEPHRQRPEICPGGKPGLPLLKDRGGQGGGQPAQHLPGGAAHRRGPDGPVRPGRRQPYRWRQRLGPFHRQLLYRGLRRRFPRGDAGGLVHRCGVLPPGGGALSLQSKKPRPNGRGFCRRTGAGWPALRRTASVTCPDQ